MFYFFLMKMHFPSNVIKIHTHTPQAAGTILNEAFLLLSHGEGISLLRLLPAVFQLYII